MKLNINMSFEQSNSSDEKNVILSGHTEYNINNIIKDIEGGKMDMRGILKKYNLTYYKYYKIIKDFEIKNESSLKRGPKGKTGPKNTSFKKMLYGTEPVNLEKIENDNTFNREEFSKDCKDGMKISELMEKYGLSLYQVRELRKKFDLKTK